jgi:carboxypeptidase Q
VLLDVIGPRVSGRPSGQRAQSHALAALTHYGLSQPRLESFPLLAWERRSTEVEITAPALLTGIELRALSLGQVGSFDIEAPVVDAGFGTDQELAELGERLRGAIVFTRVGQPSGYGRSVHRTEKITLAARAGAVGFLMAAPIAGTLVQVGVATMGDEPSAIVAVALDFESGARLDRLIAGEGSLRLRVRTRNWMERGEAANVLGDLPGDLDEWIVVGAHLDSWELGTGALDNGSGSLVLMEAARLLTQERSRGWRPRRGIRFALWMGEELGLYGSRSHVQRHPDLDRYRAVLNLDMVGEPTGFGAMGRPEMEPVLRRALAVASSAGLRLEDELRWGGGIYSDHQPFLLAGIPVITLASRLPDGAGRYYHSAGDTRDKLDEAALARAAVAAAALLRTLADAESLPPRWREDEIGAALTEMGLRDPLERGGEWRWP